MAGTIKISTDQVEAIATSIENNNKKLKSTLEDSQSAVKSLSSTWQGEAAQSTIEQNRCAMACQGCGAVLFLLKKQWNYFP